MKLSANTANQHQRLLDYLVLNHQITTLEARQKLDVMHPAARIQELREEGHNIITHRTIEDTPLGRHRIARYVLLTN